MIAPSLRVVESCEAAHREPSAPGSEAQPAVCAVPTCLDDAATDAPLCPAHWQAASPRLRGAWMVALHELRGVVRDRPGDVGRWARALVAAEAALVAAVEVSR